MKFTLFLLVSWLSSLASADTFDVKIHADCSGLDMAALTPAEKDFSVQVLTLSYNQVHQAWDGGDQYLYDLYMQDDQDAALATIDAAEDG